MVGLHTVTRRGVARRSPGGATGRSRTSVAALSLLLAVPLLAASPAPAQRPRDWSRMRVLEAGGLKAETAALIMSGQAGGSILFEVLPLPLETVGGKTRMPLIVEIDGTGLLEGQEAEVLQVEVYAYALTRSGAIGGSLIKVLEIDLEELGSQVARTGIKFIGELAVAADDYSLRVLVRNLQTGAVGLRLLDLTVPDLADPKAAFLLPPLAVGNADAWLLAQAGGNGEQAGPRLLAEGVPMIRPVLALSDKAELRLLARHLRHEPDAVVIAIDRFDGQPLEELAVASEGASTSLAGWQAWRLSLDPGRLEPGHYRIRAVLGDGDDRLSSADLPLSLVEELPASGFVWPELTGAPEKPGAAAREQTAATGKGLRVPRRDIDAAFRQALTELTAGEPRAARRILTEIETRALGGSGAALDALARVELAACKKLAAKDPESLVPVLVLYESMYRAHRNQRRFLLSTHARRMLVEIAQLYAEAGQGESSREIAAWFLANLAAELQEVGLDLFSRKMFLRALELDGDNQAALLCLASGLERHGEYARAVEHLEHVARSHPENAEGRLRLAVNLRRLDKGQRARQLLEELVASDPPAWILSIAYQELAELHLTEARPEAAAALLRQGLERLPQEEKLYLQLALVHDAERRPGQAREVLEEMDRRVSERPVSARHRYGQMPLEAFQRMRAEIQESASARLASLEAILGPKATAETP